MVGAFPVTEWYAWLVYIAGAYLLWTAAFEKGHEHARWIWRQLRPPTPEPAEKPKPPPICLGHPGGSLNLTMGADGKRRLATATPRYLIENKDQATEIRDLTTGVRTRDGREHTFTAFRAQLIGAGEKVPVENAGSIPADFLDVHESAAFTALLYWARFRRAGTRWEVVYDPGKRKMSYRVLAGDEELPPPNEEPPREESPPPTPPRRPRLVPRGGDRWDVYPIEEAGGSVMHLPVLPIYCVIENVGDDVALPHDVEAISHGLGHASVTVPPLHPRWRVRQPAAWLRLR